MSARQTIGWVSRNTYCVLRTAYSVFRFTFSPKGAYRYVSRFTFSPKGTYRHVLRFPRRGPIGTFYVLLTALLLTACSQTANPAPPPTQPPLPGSLKTVVIPIPEDPPGFNAYLSDTGYEELLGELVYEGLAEMAPDGSFYPKLALELPTRENGGISPDGLTVTWKLRDHIFWSDGEPFTSDDVRFTWQALSHPDNGLATETGFDLIDWVETPDDYTVVVHYRQPYANMLGQFGGRGLGIFPRHACGDPGRMAYWACNTQPVGTGPFVLQTWEEGKQLVFDRNPRYWQTGRPLLDRLVFPIVPRDAVRSDLLRDGDAQVNLWLTPDQIEELQDVEGVHLVSLSGRWLLRLVFNLSQPPDEGETPEAGTSSSGPHFALADPRVREALDLAIDRGRLIEEAFDGQGNVASGEFYRGWAVCPGADAGAGSPRPYNPDAARALLAQAGWLDLNGDGVLEAHGTPYAPDETKLQLTLLTYDGWDALADAQKLIAQMLRELGIRVFTDLAGPEDLWGNWEEGGLEAHGQFDLDLWDEGYPGIDPTDYLTWRYASWSIPSMADGGAGGNVMRFTNPEVDRLLQQAQAQPDPMVRRQTFCQIQRVLADERPMLYLVYFSDTYAFSSQLQGLVINPNDALTWDVINWQVGQ
jgi:peptide/nickel transport system substrate-binding protein